MIGGKFRPDEIPYFSYDRALPTTAIQALLTEPGSRGWLDTAAWIMREAAFGDVWQFLNPGDVNRYLDNLLPSLGRNRDFWCYIIGAWRELGKFEGSNAA